MSADFAFFNKPKMTLQQLRTQITLSRERAIILDLQKLLLRQLEEALAARTDRRYIEMLLFKPSYRSESSERVFRHARHLPGAALYDQVHDSSLVLFACLLMLT